MGALHQFAHLHHPAFMPRQNTITTYLGSCGKCRLLGDIRYSSPESHRWCIKLSFLRFAAEESLELPRRRHEPLLITYLKDHIFAHFIKISTDAGVTQNSIGVVLSWETIPLNHLRIKVSITDMYSYVGGRRKECT